MVHPLEEEWELWSYNIVSCYAGAEARIFYVSREECMQSVREKID